MAPWIRVLRTIAGLGAVLCCLAGGAMADAPRPDAGDGTIAVADLKADFEALYTGLQSAHFNLYVHRPKPDYDALYTRMLEDLETPLTPFEARVRFQRFVAYGNVAHARIDLPRTVYDTYRDGGGRSLPLYPRIVDGRFYVGEIYADGVPIRPGDEVLSIDGDPAARWLERTARVVSADTPYLAHSLLEFLFPFLLWLERGAVEDFLSGVLSA